MNVITGIFKEAYLLFNKMSPYLLFGFFFAGLLHIFIDTKMIGRHLGKNDLASVVKASLFGIPLPLCSCSVIPAAMSLRKEGASRGSVLSFLISTPTTGVDSIFATYSLLGGLFTAYRVMASFVAGMLAGTLANVFIKERPGGVPREQKCKMCHEHMDEGHAHNAAEKIKGVFTYAFGDLLDDTGPALLGGMIIGGAIAYFLPESFIQTYLGSGIRAMFVMLLAGIPMYVCATASIPIAAALIFKGINPGAAFVFLVAGPATNIVTMMVVSKNLGFKALVIYLGSIVFCSITMGLVLDEIFRYFYKADFISSLMHQRELVPAWLGLASSVILAVLILFNLFRKLIRKGPSV